MKRKQTGHVTGGPGSRKDSIKEVIEEGLGVKAVGVEVSRRHGCRVVDQVVQYDATV